MIADRGSNFSEKLESSMYEEQKQWQTQFEGLLKRLLRLRLDD